MPRAAASRCTKQCGKLATNNGRCDEHQRKAWENTSTRNQIIDRNKWRRAKDNHLINEPTCRVCGTDDRLTVDHITEAADGGELYDDSNLQTLCEPHHREKSRLAKRLRRARSAN